MTYSFEPTGDLVHADVFRPDVAGRFEEEPEPVAAPEPVAPTLDDNEVLERFRAAAFEEGRSAGKREAEEQLAPLAQALAAAADRLSEQRDTWLQAQRGLLAELSISIAKHVVDEHIAVSPDGIASRISAALTLADAAAPATIDLCPDDHALVTRVLGASHPAGSIELTPNPDLARGDFVVTQDATTIDARVETLLASAREALSGLETVSETSSEPGEES